ncbi:MAG: undecaprenyl-diphosphate phosphatase [Parachlamydiaceae bacterium]|nr:undecaprenyl-diphosphate phosphatase [Parachlamydiaceae bacterium]
MTVIDAIILGIIQGLTEFLPVSSSGHLELAQHLLGMKDLEQYILFNLVCHLGTLLAICFIFFNQIKSLFQHNTTRLKQLILATLPLFPLVFLMKPIKAAYADPSYLGFFFLITACILFLGVRFGKTIPEKEIKQHKWRDALIIGIWQAAAILPGVSRSGSTISGARILGWSANEAVTFSFLLAIPAILGGATLEIIKLWQHPESASSLSLTHYSLGFLISFVIGLGSLQLLIRLVTHNKFAYFAWYCLALGLATLYLTWA